MLAVLAAPKSELKIFVLGTSFPVATENKFHVFIQVEEIQKMA